MKVSKSHQTARLLSWSIAVFSALLVTIGLGISIHAQFVSGQGVIFSHQFFTPVATFTFGVVGALVASRHPRNPIGWIFCTIGFLSGLNMLGAGYVRYDQLAVKSGSLPGAAVARWLDTWIWVLNVLLPLTFLLLLFPDGRLRSPRWRPIAWAAGLGIAALVLAIAVFHPMLGEQMGQREPNLFRIQGGAEVANALITIASPLLLLGIFGSIASVIVRFRNAAGIERAQLKWLTFAVTYVIPILLLGTILWLIWPDDPAIMEVSIIFCSLAMVNIVIATGIAILRYHLWDIDIVINRTLVYGSLTALVVALYVLIVGSLGILLQSGGNLVISLVGTGIIAALFQPLRDRLQRGVNRMMYGERDDPVTILSRLGQRLEATLTPEAMLQTLVETVAQALKVPYVALEVREGEGYAIAAACGQPLEHVLRLPLIYQQQMEIIGYFIVGERGRGESFSVADQRLLENIVHRAGAAVHTVRLTADLQHSRQRIVTAREEERRRLRRDLHDGLGPALATLTLQAEAAQDLLRVNPDKSEALLGDIVAGTQAAVTDIRRVVYALRPPALDDLGLVSAIKEQAAHYTNHRLSVNVDVPEMLPLLPAAVEVAAYRIVQEALTNVSRHAEAHTCCVHLRMNGNVEIEVIDDGKGIAPTRRAGVGLNSMHERAAELGGSCVIASQPGKGTRVHVSLPREA